MENKYCRQCKQKQLVVKEVVDVDDHQEKIYKCKICGCVIMFIRTKTNPMFLGVK